MGMKCKQLGILQNSNIIEILNSLGSELEAEVDLVSESGIKFELLR
jgi:hypothetical protein